MKTHLLLCTESITDLNRTLNICFILYFIFSVHAIQQSKRAVKKTFHDVSLPRVLKKRKHCGSIVSTQILSLLMTTFALLTSTRSVFALKNRSWFRHLNHVMKPVFFSVFFSTINGIFISQCKWPVYQGSVSFSWTTQKPTNRLINYSVNYHTA